MTYLKYLYKNRICRDRIDSDFYKLWGKRVANLWGLLRLEIKRAKFSQKSGGFGNLSVISPYCELNGSISHLSIGTESYLGSAHLALHTNISIGNYSVINDGVKLLTGSHDVDCKYWSQIVAPITIGNYVWIATNAIIMPGINIKNGAVIGAGAVVTKDVGSNEVVAGNPAVCIKKRADIDFCYSPVRFLAPFEAWVGLER